MELWSLEGTHPTSLYTGAVSGTTLPTTFSESIDNQA